LYELARTTPFPKLDFGKASYSKYTENIENITTVFYKIDFHGEQPAAAVPFLRKLRRPDKMSAARSSGRNDQIAGKNKKH
jgi:hypothetical protein